MHLVGGRGLPASAAVGALFGAFVSLANASEWPALTVVSLVVGVGWSWAALAVWTGSLTRQLGWAAARGVLSLAAAVCAYYATDLTRGVYSGLSVDDPGSGASVTDWSAAVSDTLAWTAVACLGGWALGMVGARASRRDRPGLVCLLVVPVIAVVEMAYRLRATTSVPHPEIMVVTWSSVAAVAVVATMTLVWRLVRMPPRPPRRSSGERGRPDQRAHDTADATPGRPATRRELGD